MTYPFLIRPATPADKARVVQITRAINPHDWVPENYDGFMASSTDREGLFVAERDGVIVGCYSLTFTAPTDAYMAAMRIDPDYQGQGLGTLFCRAQVEQAQLLGATSVYLMSAVENLPAHRTVQKNGFVNLGEWLVHGWKPGAQLPGDPGHTRLGRISDLSLISSQVAEAICTKDSGWEIKTMTPGDWELEHLTVVEGSTGLDGYLLWQAGEDSLIIRRLEGTPAAAVDLLAFANAKAVEQGCSYCQVSLPKRSEHLLQPLGLAEADAFRAFVFRYQADEVV